MILARINMLSCIMFRGDGQHFDDTCSVVYSWHVSCDSWLKGWSKKRNDDQKATNEREIILLVY